MNEFDENFHHLIISQQRSMTDNHYIIHTAEFNIRIILPELYVNNDDHISQKSTYRGKRRFKNEE